MRTRMLGIASLGSLACLGMAVPAVAAPFTLQDTYYGGIVNPTMPANDISGGDTIEDPGTKNFQIDSAVVARPNANTLTVTINTWYAGQPPLDGTNYGSLFFGSVSDFKSVVPSNSQGVTTLAGTLNDTYHPGLWTSAFTNGGLYSTGVSLAGPLGTANDYPSNNSVVQSYTTATGKIIMSNVNGDPVSYNGTGNNGFYFRQTQAVEFDPNANATSINGITGSVSVVNSVYGPNDTPITEGSITYTINDGGFLGSSFAISWAMSCANDIIQGVIPVQSGGLQSSTPLPAALPLFVSGLGMMGFFGARRKRRTAQASAA
jgi:hypothetical protein